MKTIVKTKLETELLNFIEEQVQPLGFRVVDIDYHQAHNSILRIFIERIGEVNADTGLSFATIDDCTKVSRLISPILDVEDKISGKYDLEVSSPGMDRRLRTEEDFLSAVGYEVKLRLHDKHEGIGLNPRGLLVATYADGVRLDVSGTVHEIPFESIRRANLIWQAEIQASRKVGERNGV